MELMLLSSSIQGSYFLINPCLGLGRYYRRSCLAVGRSSWWRCCWRCGWCGKALIKAPINRASPDAAIPMIWNFFLTWGIARKASERTNERTWSSLQPRQLDFPPLLNNLFPLLMLIASLIDSYLHATPPPVRATLRGRQHSNMHLFLIRLQLGGGS